MRRKPLPKKKKPDGVSREVFALQDSLLSTSKPTVSPAPGLIFKEKRKIATDKVIWNWKPFRNTARKDNHVFYHWARSDDSSEDYRFARFNKKLTLPSYTDEEYQQHFQDSSWTKQETDELFELCWRFDMRFVVVADRMASTRTLEELKERFYSVCAKLVDIHALPEEDLSLNPLAHYSFNKPHEIARKQQSERLYQRTGEQVREEEDLINQFHRIESQLKKHNQAHKKINQLIQTTLTTSTPRGGSGAFVKSAKATTPLPVGSKTSQRVDSALVELGLGIRPNPPTPNVSKLFNDLRQDIVILLNLQKYVSQKEYQLEVLKAQRRALSEEAEKRGISANQQNSLSSVQAHALSSSSTRLGLTSFDLEDVKGLDDPSSEWPEFNTMTPPSNTPRSEKEKDKPPTKKQKI